MKNIYLTVLICSNFLLLANSSFAEIYQPPFTVEKLHFHFKVNPNGSYTETREKITRINNKYGVDEYSSHRFKYIGDQEKLQIVDAFTTSAEGKKISLSKNWIKKHNPNGSSRKISDDKKVTIIFPDVSIGSRLYSKIKIHHFNPSTKGEFSIKHSLFQALTYENVEISIEALKPTKLFTQSRGFEGGIHFENKQTVQYKFIGKKLEAIRDEEGSIDEHDISPYLVVSTFPSYIEIGLSYDRVAKLRSQVTPDIQKLSTELTLGLTAEKDKAKVLYNWVSKNIRYVSTPIGAGRIQPHPADEVLRHRYGDCKDHVALLEAMLKAAGIPSVAALINSGESFDLPDGAADYYPLNHVITYLPTLDLYVDSTAQLAPFGTLPDVIMDKPTVLTSQAKIGRTPSMLAKDNSVRSEIHMTMNGDGSITGKTVAKMTGSLEIESRSNRYGDDQAGEEKVVRDLFYRFNEIGDGKLSYTDPEDLNSAYEVRSTFTLDSIVDATRNGAFRVPVGLAPGRIAAYTSYRPINQRRMPYVCDSHTDEDNYQITVPTQLQITQLPEDTYFNDGERAYQSHYSLDKQVITVQRKLTTQMPSRVCNSEQYEKWKKLLTLIRKDQQALIIFAVK